MKLRIVWPLPLSIVLLVMAVAPAIAQQQLAGNSPPPPVYSNGPVNGTVTAWLMNQGVEISDSISTAGSPYPFTITFGIWINGGSPVCVPLTACLPTGLDFALGTSPFAGDLAFQHLNVTGVAFHNFVLGPNPLCTVVCVVYTAVSY